MRKSQAVLVVAAFAAFAALAGGAFHVWTSGFSVDPPSHCSCTISMAPGTLEIRSVVPAMPYAALALLVGEEPGRALAFAAGRAPADGEWGVARGDGWVGARGVAAAGDVLVPNGWREGDLLRIVHVETNSVVWARP